MDWLPSDIDVENRASLEERINSLEEKLAELERRLRRLEEQSAGSILINSPQLELKEEEELKEKRDQESGSQSETIQLTYEEFLHVSSHEPGTCDCEVCKRFWADVKEWPSDVQMASGSESVRSSNDIDTS